PAPFSPTLHSAPSPRTSRPDHLSRSRDAHPARHSTPLPAPSSSAVAAARSARPATPHPPGPYRSPPAQPAHRDHPRPGPCRRPRRPPCPRLSTLNPSHRSFRPSMARITHHPQDHGQPHRHKVHYSDIVIMPMWDRGLLLGAVPV